MNHKKHYDLLIERARRRLLEGYTETHHIVPVCMGGGNRPSNLVQLTPEEHYTAHQLLIKIYPSAGKLVYAALLMTTDATGRRVNNKLYGWIKRKISEEKKGHIPWNKGKTRPPFSDEWKQNLSIAQKNRIRVPLSEETKSKISESLKGNVPHNKGVKTPVVSCPHCEKEGGISIMKRWHFDNCKGLA